MSKKEFDLWNKYGATQKENENYTLGPHSSYEWKTSIRRLLFSSARYKFAAKMIGNIYEPNTKSILELGCSDGFGVWFLAEHAKSVLGVDFDAEAIEFAKKQVELQHRGGGVSFKKEDFLGNKYGSFDGVVSFDVIEHIYPENESLYMSTVLQNLNDFGTFVVGTPSAESQKYSRENVTGAHVNVYTGERFYGMLKQYFEHVYLFTQNDEIIHTGYLPMANYLVAVCSMKKDTRSEQE